MTTTLNKTEMMESLKTLRSELELLKKPYSQPKTIYYKTGPGDYAEHDQFIGVSVPELRKVAKRYQTVLPFSLLQELLYSSINEERLLALLMLVTHYQKGDIDLKQTIFQFYLTHINQINNWNLVDASAHWIVGAHLLDKDKTLLFTLAESTNLWEKRIAIVATWYFIRNNHFDCTLKLAEKLLCDDHDLIHKAVGWMLREVGKRNQAILIEFLDSHAYRMPRTMLRYAIERLMPITRKSYLLAKPIECI
ncbi:DNA alkylation repair enzyme [Legionella pneumophila]|uniref:DNA alkylation repair enzyme n=10 Tax=Legionellaceae TaxID=444 RepID=A0A378KLL8_9GAMM|nr:MULTISPECIES: DNA alkylation repair protein [Legionellaceae]AMV16111.1 DNA alkylation repair enzyme [Legionella pneumophila]AUH74062.1 DNA alkylation repair protein [Legionella sainthelensi]KTC67653.1 DNA alkylation repair enzyme [Legionella anisa]KTC82880.1 DNA alkylation repair enzyme [Legionella cherrii]KTC88398.1 DNA alkylation repair enzyme [Fluoribacter dumoffii NY 23]